MTQLIDGVFWQAHGAADEWLLFVYRVFDTVSFAILLNTTEPINLGDVVHKP